MFAESPSIQNSTTCLTRKVCALLDKEKVKEIKNRCFRFIVSILLKYCTQRTWIFNQKCFIANKSFFEIHYIKRIIKLKNL